MRRSGITSLIPLLDVWGGMAWGSAGLIAVFAVILGLRGRNWEGLLILPVLPAVLGQVGTWWDARSGMAALAVLSDAEVSTRASWAFIAAVDSEAHGYLAAGICLFVVALTTRRPAMAPSSGWARALLLGALGAVVCLSALAAVPAVMSPWASGVPPWGLHSLWVGVTALWAALAAWLMCTAVGTEDPRPSVALSGGISFVLVWLGVRHVLLAALHVPPSAFVEFDWTSWFALQAVMTIGIGTIVALVLVGIGLALTTRATAPRSSALHLIWLVMAVLGAVNTAELADLGHTLSGGIAAQPRLPTTSQPAPIPEGDCVAIWQESGWQVQNHWPQRVRSVSCAGSTVPRLRVFPGDFPARDLVSADLQPGEVLSVLVADAAIPEPSPPPLVALRQRSVSFMAVPVSIPSEFRQGGLVVDQLDAWLSEQLGEPVDPFAENLWVIDTPQGPMVLVLRVGLTAESASEREEVFRRLLEHAEEPRLVLAPGARWTVQDAVDLCQSARHLPNIPPATCVILASEQESSP